MNFFRHFALALAVTCTGFVSFGQLLLTGEVTGASGIYAERFVAGDAMSLSLDFASRPNYSLHRDLPGVAVAWPLEYLVVAGESIPLSPGPAWEPSLGAFLQSKPQELTGFYISGGTGLFGKSVALRQQFLSESDVLLAGGFFPSGIPITEFSERRGSYEIYDIYPVFQLSSKIDWVITGYSGSFGPLTLVTPPPDLPFVVVPEQSIYGLVSALGLGGLAFLRGRKQRSFP